MGLPKARVIEVLGDPSAPRAVSLIAIHQHGIPDDFPDAVVAEADAARPAKLEGREDLTDLNFVTIDPADARDRDDAVLVLPDDDPKNAGGHHLWVAIADVAHYVTPGSELDREARKRGNSSYFPDRVVPMLPDSLSGDLCSLHENVDRAVLAVKMTIDAQGRKIAHRFTRGMIRSIASLEYSQVQDAQDGNPDEKVNAAATLKRKKKASAAKVNAAVMLRPKKKASAAKVNVVAMLRPKKKANAAKVNVVVMLRPKKKASAAKVNVVVATKFFFF